jgi:hypothetical protein
MGFLYIKCSPILSPLKLNKINIGACHVSITAINVTLNVEGIK